MSLISQLQALLDKVERFRTRARTWGEADDLILELSEGLNALLAAQPEPTQEPEHVSEQSLRRVETLRSMKFGPETVEGSAPTPSAWQPIETAKHEENVQILFLGPDGVDIGCWQDEKPASRESGVIVEDGMNAGWFGSCGYWPGGNQPTHWMPLPLPPADADKEP